MTSESSSAGHTLTARATKSGAVPDQGGAPTPAVPATPKPAPKSANPGSNKALRALGTVGLRAIVPVLIIAIWWGLSTSPIYGLFIPPPLEALGTFVDRVLLGDGLMANVLPSLGRAVIGLGLAIVLGVAIGVLLGTSSTLIGLFQPLIHLGRSLPSPALLGVFFFLFGTGDLPKISLITFSVVWPILLNTIDGVGAVGETRAQAAQVFKIPGHRVLTGIILPGAAPKIFAGIRTSMAYSLILMIISELQRSTNGLGYLLVESQREFDYATFFAVLITLVIIGIVFNLIFLTIERRVLAWHRGANDND